MNALRAIVEHVLRPGDSIVDTDDRTWQVGDDRCSLMSVDGETTVPAYLVEMLDDDDGWAGFVRHDRGEDEAAELAALYDADVWREADDELARRRHEELDFSAAWAADIRQEMSA